MKDNSLLNEFEVLTNNVRQNLVTRGGKVILPSTELTDMPSSYSSGSILVSGTSSYSLATPASLGMMNVVEATGATSAAIQTYYVCNNVSRVEITLPATAIFGSMIGIIGKGAGGWKVLQNAGQTIHSGYFASLTGTGGYVQSRQYKDTIFLVCITANTDWAIVWASGAVDINVS